MLASLCNECLRPKLWLLSRTLRTSTQSKTTKNAFAGFAKLRAQKFGIFLRRSPPGHRFTSVVSKNGRNRFRISGQKAALHSYPYPKKTFCAIWRNTFGAISPIFA